MFDYFQLLTDYAKETNKKMSQVFILLLPNGVDPKTSAEAKNYKYERMIYKWILSCTIDIDSFESNFIECEIKLRLFYEKCCKTRNMKESDC